MEEAHAPVTVLASLREYGLRLMLDDFGTGYSSLSYLKRFPLDVLKIDRSFVAGLGRDEEDSAIVAAIVQMAQTLGLIGDRGGRRAARAARAAARARLRPRAGPADRRADAGRARRAADGAPRRPCRDGASSTATTTCSPSASRTGDRRLPRRRRRGPPRPPAGRGGRARRRLLRRLHRQPARGRLRRRAPTSRRSTTTRARAEALAQVALLLRLERESGGRLRIARTAADLDGDGLAAVLHLEGAEPIGTGARRAARCCTPPACARSGSSGAGRTRSRPASRSASPARPTRARG